MHGPMDYGKTLKPLFLCRGPAAARKKRNTSSRDEEEEEARMCPCSEAIESKTYTVGECEMHKEERHVIEEMRKTEECNMEKFGALLIDGSEKTIAVLPNRKGIRRGKCFCILCGTKRDEPPNVEGVSFRSRNGAPSRKGCAVNGQKTRPSKK